MRIGIDISQIVYKGTGVGRFVAGLLDTICAIPSDHEWVFFFSGFRLRLDKEIQKKISSAGHTLVQLPFPPKLLSFLWNSMHILPVDFFTGKLDWFITSDWTEPPAKCKKATIIHDLSVFKYPETVDVRILKTQKKRLKLVSQESSLVFADSDATLQDIHFYFPNMKAYVHRIYPGVKVQIASMARIKEVKKTFNLNKSFILSVGKLEPRKNIARLIEVFQKINLPNTELVIVGGYGWGSHIRSEKKVRLLGYVDDSSLHALYQACLFFAYPSIWEGFGYPVIEAMQHGVPVATSNTSSLKEIARGAGLLFDPLNQKDMAHCLRLLASNQKLRSEMKRKSLKRGNEFSWPAYYHEMMKSLENAK